MVIFGGFGCDSCRAMGALLDFFPFCLMPTIDFSIESREGRGFLQL